jgi:gluconate 5-dehydrogenase
MVRTLASEVSGSGIRVNAIAPGWIDSEMMRGALDGDPARRDKILGRTPMGRFGEPVEVAKAIVFVASPAVPYMTGANIVVDGGFTQRVQF